MSSSFCSVEHCEGRRYPPAAVGTVQACGSVAETNEMEMALLPWTTNPALVVGSSSVPEKEWMVVVGSSLLREDSSWHQAGRGWLDVPRFVLFVRDGISRMVIVDASS